MLLYKDSYFSIFFGDEQERFIPVSYHQLNPLQMLSKKPFDVVCNSLPLTHAVFLHQVHSAQGMVVHSEKELHSFPIFGNEGDFLVSHIPGVGLGVATADCLPIVLCDTLNHVVSIVHAGWRGSLDGVTLNALSAMQCLYGTQLSNVQVFFGPCAHVCCYEVKEDFVAVLKRKGGHVNAVITQREKKLFFDLPLFNRLQLMTAGIKENAFNVDYTLCTICNDRFCSVRRQNGSKYRQMTIVVRAR